ARQPGGGTARHAVGKAGRQGDRPHAPHARGTLHLVGQGSLSSAALISATTPSNRSKYLCSRSFAGSEKAAAACGSSSSRAADRPSTRKDGWRSAAVIRSPALRMP